MSELSGVSDLYPVETRSNPSSCNNPKCLQMLSDVPWGQPHLGTPDAPVLGEVAREAL